MTELEPRKLYVYLDAEFKSAGVLGNDSDIDEPDCIEFEIIPKELKDAVVSLRTCLQAFPNRTYAD